MSATIQRRRLTALVLDTVKGAEGIAAKLVGDSVIPKGGGWLGAPNAPASRFVPYVVVTTLTARQSTGDLQRAQGDWQVPYMVQAFHITREGCEWMADATRDALAGLRNTVIDLGDGHYTVQQIWTDSIGGVNRVPEQDPPFFGQQDGITVWLSRRRTP